MISIRQTVLLSGGTVVLKAWATAVQDAYLLDILTLSATLGAMREEWQEFKRGDIEKAVWGSFWRLVNASLEENSALPERINWLDRWTLLEAMLELNDEGEAEKKAQALTLRATQMMGRLSPNLMMTSTPS